MELKVQCFRENSASGIIMPVLVNSETISILEYLEHYNYSASIVKDATLQYFSIIHVFPIASLYSFHSSRSRRDCVLLSEDNTTKKIFGRFQCYLLWMARGLEVNHLQWNIHCMSFSPSTSLVFLCFQRSHHDTLSSKI